MLQTRDVNQYTYRTLEGVSVYKVCSQRTLSLRVWMAFLKRWRVVRHVSSARHSGMLERQLQPRFRQVSCLDIKSRCRLCHCWANRSVLQIWGWPIRAGVTGASFSLRRGWAGSVVYLCRREKPLGYCCLKTGFWFASVKPSRLLLLHPSLPIVYRHVFIAMEMWDHGRFSPTHFYEACAQLRFCTASSWASFCFWFLPLQVWRGLQEAETCWPSLHASHSRTKTKTPSFSYTRVSASSASVRTFSSTLRTMENCSRVEHTSETLRPLTPTSSACNGCTLASTCVVYLSEQQLSELLCAELLSLPRQAYCTSLTVIIVYHAIKRRWWRHSWKNDLHTP